MTLHKHGHGTQSRFGKVRKHTFTCHLKTHFLLIVLTKLPPTDFMLCYVLDTYVCYILSSSVVQHFHQPGPVTGTADGRLL